MALFTAGSEFQIGVCGANKHPMLPWQQWSKDVNKGRFGTSPLKIYLHARFEWGSKIFISHFVWFLQRTFLNKRTWIIFIDSSVFATNKYKSVIRIWSVLICDSQGRNAFIAVVWKPNVSGGNCQVINKLLKVVERHLQRQNIAVSNSPRPLDKKTKDASIQG